MSQLAIWESKVLSGLRVTESSTSTVSEDSQEAAMNLLHGDHAAAVTQEQGPGTETGPHETGNPCITPAKGQAYSLYSLCIIEV